MVKTPEENRQSRNKSYRLKSAPLHLDSLAMIIEQTNSLPDPVSEFAKMFNEEDLKNLENLIYPAVLKAVRLKSMSEMNDDIDGGKEVKLIYKRVVSHLKKNKEHAWKKTVHKKIPPKTIRRAIVRLLPRIKSGDKRNDFPWEEAFDLLRDNSTIPEFLQDLEDNKFILKESQPLNLNSDILLQGFAEESDKILLSKEEYNWLQDRSHALYIHDYEKHKLSASLVGRS